MATEWYFNANCKTDASGLSERFESFVDELKADGIEVTYASVSQTHVVQDDQSESLVTRG